MMPIAKDNAMVLKNNPYSTMLNSSSSAEVLRDSVAVVSDASESDDCAVVTFAAHMNIKEINSNARNIEDKDKASHR